LLTRWRSGAVSEIVDQCLPRRSSYVCGFSEGSVEASGLVRSVATSQGEGRVISLSWTREGALRLGRAAPGGPASEI